MRRAIQILEIAYNALKTNTLSIPEPVVLKKRISRTVDSGIVSWIFCCCKRFTFDKTHAKLKRSATLAKRAWYFQSLPKRYTPNESLVRTANYRRTAPTLANTRPGQRKVVEVLDK